MTLVYGGLVTFIVTVIVTESYIFAPIRELAHRVSQHLGVLFGCFLCFGTWAGIGVGYLIGEYHWFLSGLAYHGFAYLLWTFVNFVGDLRIKLQQ